MCTTEKNHQYRHDWGAFLGCYVSVNWVEVALIYLSRSAEWSDVCALVRALVRQSILRHSRGLEMKGISYNATETNIYIEYTWVYPIDPIRTQYRFPCIIKVLGIIRVFFGRRLRIRNGPTTKTRLWRFCQCRLQGCNRLHGGMGRRTQTYIRHRARCPTVDSIWMENIILFRG